MSGSNPLSVLMIDEEVPFPLNTGKRLRTFNLLQRLQSRHHITYLCYGEVPEDLPELSNVEFVCLPSQILPQRGISFYYSLFKNIFSSNPYTVDRHFSENMLAAVETLLNKNKYDLLYCEWTPYTPMLEPFFRQYPSVLSTHNVEAQIWKRLWETETNLPKKMYINLQRKKMFQFEKKAVALYTENSAVSEPDKQLLQDWYGITNVTVVPNGVDEAFFAPQEQEIKPCSMVFTGSMDWRPNQDAMKYFLNEIYPLVLQAVPEASLTIVGRNPPRWLEEMSTEFSNVTVTGTVDDVRPYIAEASLYIVPLRIGGGSRLKILEALSMQKLVLSTSIGAEGLNLDDGVHLLLQNGAESFAKSAIAALTQPEKFKNLAEEGRQRTLESYTWDAIAQVMDGVWYKAVEQQ